MHHHLDQGGQKSSKTMVIGQSITDTYLNEADCRAAEGTVRAIEASCASYPPREIALQVAKTAQLVYDSFRQPLPGGVRASSASSRQLLYRLGHLVVDMRTEIEARPGRISLVGQILGSAGGARRGRKGLPVLLLRDKDTVAKAMTNEFGEFQFEFEAGQQLHVSIEIGQGIAVLIPLRSVEPRDKPARSKDEFDAPATSDVGRRTRGTEVP